MVSFYCPVKSHTSYSMGNQRSDRQLLAGQTSAISTLSLSRVVLQVADGIFSTFWSRPSTGSQFKEYFHLWPEWTFALPSQQLQQSVKHCSQALFHSPSQPLNSASKGLPEGHIDQVPSTPFPGGVVVTPKMMEMLNRDILSSTVSTFRSVNPLLCHVTCAEGP